MFNEIVKTKATGTANSVVTHALTLIFAFTLAFTTSQVQSKEQALDIALVLDASGSMKKNDPNRLRVEAAKMFVHLLDRNDRASVISFSSRAYPVTKLLSLNTKKNETTLLRSIDKMAATGKFTNLHDALLQGYKVLQQDKDSRREKHIILMSDGQMDLGNKERNLRLLEKTLDKLTPKLAKDNIKVHTIAFTKDSYIPLLKLTAEDTGGQFIMLEKADGVHEVFDHLFQRTKTPEEIPLKEDSFIVDENIKELTIVASKYKSGSVISLESPNSDDITKSSDNKNIKWFSAEKFDLITIKNPTPGFWLVKFSEGGNKAYVVSNLSLIAETTKRTAEVGTPLHVKAFLSKKGRIVKNKTLLKASKFNVTVTSPAGSVISNELFDDGSEIGSERHDGIYGISYAFDKEGTYKIEVNLSNETFDRKKTLFVDVKSFQPKKPFVPQDQPKPLPAVMPEEPIIEEEPIEDTSQNQVEDTTEHGSESLDPSQDEELESHNKDESAKHAESMEGEDGEEQSGGDYSLKEAIIFFVLFNVLLAAGGAGYYFYYRRQKQQKSKETETEEVVKNPDAFKEDSVDLSDNSDEFGDMDEEHDAPNLESTEIASEAGEDGEASTPEATDGLSDIDLEEELSSILENEETNKGE